MVFKSFLFLSFIAVGMLESLHFSLLHIFSIYLSAFWLVLFFYVHIFHFAVDTSREWNDGQAIHQKGLRLFACKNNALTHIHIISI